MRGVAADMLIVKKGKIVLVKRKNEPFKGSWALPGGRIEEQETIEECAKREAKEETGLKVEPYKLIGVYSNPKRDPRGIIGIAFLCRVVGGKLRAGSDAEEVGWFEIEKAKNMRLAFDHNKILNHAIKEKKT